MEAKFRKDVTERVKSNLLMESIAQITEDEELSAISEPDFDVEAVVGSDEDWRNRVIAYAKRSLRDSGRQLRAREPGEE